MSCLHKFCQALSSVTLFLYCWLQSCSEIDVLSRGNNHLPDLEYSLWNIILIKLIGQVFEAYDSKSTSAVTKTGNSRFVRIGILQETSHTPINDGNLRGSWSQCPNGALTLESFHP